MNLGEALLAALRDHGARQVFGIPGDFVLGFFKVIEQSGILPLYTLSHEPAVGFAADAATANVVIAAPQDGRILPGPGEPATLAPTALVVADLLTLPGRSDAEAEQLMDALASIDPSWKE